MVKRPQKRVMILFVEGANSERADLRAECRQAFRELFDRAGLRAKPRVSPEGSRRDAFDAFCAALGRAGPDDQIWLLVDSEAPVSVECPWDHVKQREGDGWTKPSGATTDHLHLMVEFMETWFLADPDALEAYFGKGFHRAALPKRPDIESICKADVLACLHAATKATKSGPYGKGKHSFALLARLDPAKLERASPWASRLFRALAED